MKVIFIKDLKGQGKVGEIKEVKDGYGKNYLIKNGYAVMASSTSLKRLDDENEQKKIQEENDLEEASKIKKELEKMTLVYFLKTGNNDKVFGSISSKQISLSLKEKGYDIDKHNIRLDFPISTLGFHQAEIELHKSVNARIRIEIKKEG